MDLNLNFEVLFIENLQNLLKSHSHREIALILDAILALNENLSVSNTENLLNFLKENLKKFSSPRTQNMLVSLLKNLDPDKISEILFDLLSKTEYEKVKTQIITAFIELEIKFSEDQLEDIFSAFFEADWELRDSVLSLIIKCFREQNFDALISAKFLSLLQKGLTDDVPSVRATALGSKIVPKIFEKFEPDWENGIKEIVKMTSSDLDYNVRRTGIDVLASLIDQKLDIFLEALRSRSIFTNIDYDEFKPVLNYERTTISDLGDLFEYLSYDDDWEVKVKLVRLLSKLLGHIRGYK